MAQTDTIANLSTSERAANTELAKLQNASNILQLVHIRNKNQHRRSPWWRHFNAFRRQLAKLVADQRLAESGSASAVNTVQVLGKSKREGALRVVESMAKRRAAVTQASIDVERRVRFWEEHCVGRWWASFTSLLGDLQWAPLALVLLGVLAEVCQVVGITERLKESGMKIEGEHTIEEALETAQRRVGEKGDVVDRMKDELEREDMGERVERVEIDTGDEIVEQTTKKRGRDDPELQISVASKRRKRPEKVRKKRDAIDDLFNGLL